eukprot:3208931-Alexandrium_andersonii.AAC.1
MSALHACTLRTLLHPPSRHPPPFGAFRPTGRLLVTAIGLSAHNDAERTPRELRGPILRPFLGP